MFKIGYIIFLYCDSLFVFFVHSSLDPDIQVCLLLLTIIVVLSGILQHVDDTVVLIQDVIYMALNVKLFFICSKMWLV